jgi:hypothetical protein
VTTTTKTTATERRVGVASIPLNGSGSGFLLLNLTPSTPVSAIFSTLINVSDEPVRVMGKRGGPSCSHVGFDVVLVRVLDLATILERWQAQPAELLEVPHQQECDHLAVADDFLDSWVAQLWAGYAENDVVEEAGLRLKEILAWR